MAGFANQAKFYVRLALMRKKPSVIKPKLNEVTGMENNPRQIVNRLYL